MIFLPPCGWQHCAPDEDSWPSRENDRVKNGCTRADSTASSLSRRRDLTGRCDWLADSHSPLDAPFRAHRAAGDTKETC